MKISELRLPKRALFVVLLILIGLSACTTLLFKTTMPIEAEITTILPKFLVGTFVSVHHDSTTFMATYHRIEHFSDRHCIIHERNVVYLDTSSSAVLGITAISEVLVEYGGFRLRSNKSDKFIPFDDSLSSEREVSSAEINLKEGYFINDFDEMKKLKAVLKTKDNVFYLNAHYKDMEQWQIMRAKEYDGYLGVVTSSSLSESIAERVAQAMDKYAMERVYPDKNAVYLADVNDEAFDDLINSGSYFPEYQWFKIPIQQPKSNNWMIPIILLALMLIGWVIWKFRS